MQLGGGERPDDEMQNAGPPARPDQEDLQSSDVEGAYRPGEGETDSEPEAEEMDGESEAEERDELTYLRRWLSETREYGEDLGAQLPVTLDEDEDEDEDEGEGENEDPDVTSKIARVAADLARADSEIEEVEWIKADFDYSVAAVRASLRTFQDLLDGAGHVAVNPSRTALTLEVRRLLDLCEEGPGGDHAADVTPALENVRDAIDKLVSEFPSLKARRDELEALDEIYTEQGLVEPAISRRKFSRLAKEIAQDYMTDVKLAPEAVDGLLAASEDYLLGILRGANSSATHADRTFIGPPDVELARMLRGEELSPSYEPGRGRGHAGPSAWRPGPAGRAGAGRPQASPRRGGAPHVPPR